MTQEPRQAGQDLTTADVLAAVGGARLFGPMNLAVPGFSIDSRTVPAGHLFFAIRGERFDGHRFVGAALERGACGAVVSEPVADLPPSAADRFILRVPDTTAALQDLARWIRRRSGARVVAITGSVGKTTTKEMAAAFVGLRHRVMRSGGNFNNHIGLPLSLLELRHGADVAVVELGMNHAGEIRRLVSIAEPDVRVWTRVAEVHSEFFASIDEIAEAKAEILDGATPNQLLVANADDPLVMRHAARHAGRRVTFGASGTANIRATAIEDLGLDGTRAVVETPAGNVTWRLPLLGRGNLFNSLAALAVGLEYDVPPTEMAERAASMTPAPHRGEVVRLTGGITVIDDAYNSNPRAVQAALAVLASAPGRRVAVLGEMLELGEVSTALHEECGTTAAQSGLGLLLTVGGAPAEALGRAAARAGLADASVRHAATSAEAAEIAAGLVQAGDVVLVKGSRGIRTEQVVERLKAQFA